MEKHTISALITAGAGVLGAIVHVIIMKKAKAKKEAREQAKEQQDPPDKN